MKKGTWLLLAGGVLVYLYMKSRGGYQGLVSVSTTAPVTIPGGIQMSQ